MSGKIGAVERADAATHARQQILAGIQHAEDTEGAIKSFGLALRSTNETTREVEFTASTDRVDSYGDSVTQNWQLERYKTNPVVLFAHDSRSLPIGFCTNVGVEMGALVCTIRFATAEANPQAELVWQSILQKTLRAVSVGFQPHTVRREVRNDVDVWILDDNELFEISVTPVPANQDALARMKAKSLGLSREPAATKNDDTNRRESGTEPTTMDIKELQAQLDLRTTELKAAKDLTSAAEAKTADADAKLVAIAKEKADISTSHATLEKALAPLQQLSTDVDAALKAANVPMEIAIAEPKAGEPATKGLTTAERIAFVASQRDKALDQNVEHEVEALVGFKITPAEKEEFVELRKSNPGLFAKMVAKRGDLGLAGRKMGKDPNPAPKNLSAPDDELGDMLDASANGAAPAPADLGGML